MSEFVPLLIVEINQNCMRYIKSKYCKKYQSNDVKKYICLEGCIYYGQHCDGDNIYDTILAREIIKDKNLAFLNIRSKEIGIKMLCEAVIRKHRIKVYE